MMSFKEVFKTSWRNVFKYKSLWFMGIFVSGASILLEYNPDDINQFFSTLASVGVINWFTGLAKAPAFLLLIILGLILAVVFALISVIASAGLLAAVGQIKNEARADFKYNIKAGLSRFAPMIVAAVWFFIPLFFLFILTVIFYQFELFFLSSLVGILMFVYMFFIYLFKHFASCYIVLEQYPAWAAIMAGFKFFIRNWSSVLVAHLIDWGILLAFFLASFLIAALVAIPFILIGAILILFSGWSLPFVTIMIGIVVYGLVTIIMSGIRVCFSYNFLTHTYWQLKK